MAQEVALHKRGQITRSGRTMFAWVAGASVVVGFTVVVAWFLIQHIAFRHEVASVKHDTVSDLVASNKATSELKENILLLETNEALNSAKASPEEKALQVILDALPAEENSLALGASLQNKLVEGQPNVKLNELSVTDIYVDSGKSESIGQVPSDKETVQVPFRMSVSSSDPNMLRDLLKRLEASVRIMDVDVMKIERSDTEVSIVLTGNAFYLPEKTVNLKKETVKPGGKSSKEKK